ncbi:hypothetical protein V494_08082, partial [Pseudogymnoascus sp. VKM F-4513 (FW-928)]
MASTAPTTAGSQATIADAHALSLPVDSREYAEHLTAQDPLKHLRDEFLIPSKADLARETLPEK